MRCVASSSLYFSSSSAPIMTVPKKYPPVGKCIYCGATSYTPNDSLAKLRDEHIIPLAFGGNLLLPEASCKKCERITSRIETHCIEQMVRDTREHLGLTARRHRRARGHLPVSIDHGTHTEVRRVPAEEHPATLFMFAFEPPTLLSGADDPPGRIAAGKIAIRALTPDFMARVNRIPGKINLVRRGGFTAHIFCQMLAKIAHSYAVAEIGLDALNPILPDFIRGEQTPHPARFVGGSFIPEIASGDRNEIRQNMWPTRDGKQYVVVRIRLFADLDMPDYLIVAGDDIRQSPPTTRDVMAETQGGLKED